MTPVPAGRGPRQVVLPWGKSAAISIRSLRVRFFRSLVTVLALALAVSFLSFVQVSADVADGLLKQGGPEIIRELENRGYDLSPGATAVGRTAKQRWIAVLSLLVCVVGIANAQLMAVTERFREIGTMKCLGALNRFVVRLFVLEAGFQGLAGSLAGAFFGALFALAGGLLSFGGAAVSGLSWGAVLLSVAKSAGVGVLVSLIGAAYPAVVAARMQPAEAMRSEV